MPKLGNVRRFYVGADRAWLAGEQSNSFNRTANPIEVTDKSVTWQQFIAGVRGATASVTVYADDTTGLPQASILEAWEAGQKVKCFVGEIDSTGVDPVIVSGDAFEAVITAISDTNNSNEVASRDVQLNVSGPVTHYAEGTVTPAVTPEPEDDNQEPEDDNQEE